MSGWTETQYDNSSGTPEVEAFSIAGAGHVLPIEGEGMETDAIDFMGLNTTTTQGNTVSVTNPGSQTATVGTAASLQVHASDSAAGQTLTYSAAGLPAGLSINSATGLISGTPTTAGTYSVTVTATDTTRASGSAAFTWTVSSSGGGGGAGLPCGVQHDQPVDGRVHRERHDHQHRLVGVVQLDAEVHLPRRPAHHQRLEWHGEPEPART